MLGKISLILLIKRVRNASRASDCFTSSTDNYNVAVGFNAGEQVTTGTNNTLIGSTAGASDHTAQLTTGSNNVIIGFNMNTSGNSSTNQIALGVGFACTGNNNFAFGKSSLKNYDVYNTSTNKAIWDDRYTKLGSSIDIGIGYDFGKIRTEISYAQETGRFDEYLTYFDNSITQIDNDRGKLHKDFYIINTYYDFRDSKRFSPFIGLGLGFVNSSQDSAPFIPEYLRQAFVLQLKGGLSYKISDKNLIYVEGFKRNANSHTTNDGLGTDYIYEAKNGFDSSGLQIGFRKIL